jgi:transcriptional regulator with XRE-family HTH domain
VEQQERAKRVELTHFLRTRRERVSPADVGLGTPARRRSTGLRRAEVAQLADVSVTWYTWLEQGRPVRVSATTLSNVAMALRLSTDETVHLFTLADRPLQSFRGEIVSGELQRLLRGIGPNPAYFTNHCWDVMATNDAAALGLFDFPADRPAIERNLVYDILTNPRRRLEIVNWEDHARRIVGTFRGSYARHSGDPRFGTIIKRCLDDSAEFRQWWHEHEVTGQRPGSIELNHREWGRIGYTFVSFRTTEASDLRMTIYTPASADLDRRLRNAIEEKNGR